MANRIVVRFLALIPLALVGCSRSVDENSSKIRIVIPENVSSKGVSAQAVDTSNMCFAVNVYGPGIDSGVNGCGVRAGIASQFVRPGGEIAVDVPMGSDRNIQLLRYEMAAGSTTCPALSLSDCPSESATLCSVYPSGSAIADVNSAEVQVAIQLDVSSATSVATRGGCATGEVQAVLLASGEVLDPATLVEKGAKDPTRVAVTLNGNSLESWTIDGKSDTGLMVPQFIRSITRKPDTTQLYGLKPGVGDFDRMVSLNGSGGLQVLPLNSECPFDTCRVPKWIQSVSAGYGTSLFGLDAGGGVYKLTSSAPVKVKTINANVEQAVIY